MLVPAAAANLKGAHSEARGGVQSVAPATKTDQNTVLAVLAVVWVGLGCWHPPEDPLAYKSEGGGIRLVLRGAGSVGGS